jgi:BirA family biotin operon repressor/biotin-[acetyl-CoA-carboxylase] ligase
MPAAPELTLDRDRILRETFVARVEHSARLSSTNDRAKLAAADGGGPLPMLFIADEQTAGRGRGKNRWWSGSGGLTFSLLIDLIDLRIDRSRSPLMGLAAGAALVGTVGPELAPHRVGLHWPNDIYVAGRKLAGILVEIPTVRHCVIGVGLNTNNSLDEAPSPLRTTAASMGELTGGQHDHTMLLVGFLRRLRTLLWQLAAAPQSIGELADSLCLQHGRQLTLEIAGRTISGRCAGIASDGALLLETAEGRRAFYAGVLR